MSHTKKFDEAMGVITSDRGSVYGHPIINFSRIAHAEQIIAECPDPAVRHALNMIWVKVCRLIQTPDHLDSAIDIAGYARTICMIQDGKE